jgi:DNA ligase (NAD+)
LLEVRGEVYMTRRAFESSMRGSRRPANASSTRATRRPARLRQIDPAMTAQRPLEFFAYGKEDARLCGESHSMLLDVPTRSASR